MLPDSAFGFLSDFGLRSSDLNPYKYVKEQKKSWLPVTAASQRQYQTPLRRNQAEEPGRFAV
jgi:hypothetical protein